jgi:hypothetical protein
MIYDPRSFTHLTARVLNYKRDICACRRLGPSTRQILVVVQKVLHRYSKFYFLLLESFTRCKLEGLVDVILPVNTLTTYRHRVFLHNMHLLGRPRWEAV